MEKPDEAEVLVAGVVARLKAIREAKKLSLRQLENLCGVTDGGIHHIENGNRSPSLYALARIATALGWRIGDVITAVESGNSNA
ncbi:hypothetical protein BH23VER1_BH23VER1_07210 [soil metagenome]